MRDSPLVFLLGIYPAESPPIHGEPLLKFSVLDTFHRVLGSRFSADGRHFAAAFGLGSGAL